MGDFFFNSLISENMREILEHVNNSDAFIDEFNILEFNIEDVLL